MPKGRGLPLVLLSSGGAIVAAAGARVVVRGPLVGFDDANIYMAYGRNAAAGHGFVYYAGGERVEGFTSIAWTLITAAAFWLSESGAELVLFGISVSLLAVTWLVMLRYLLTEPTIGACNRLLTCGLFLGWCASNPAYVIWMTGSLMETGLWSAVVCIGAVAFARMTSPNPGSLRWVAAALAVVAVAARPEAMMIVPVWIGTTVLAGWIAHRDLARMLRAVAPSAAATAIGIVALTAFRFAYFGYPLPNTYYAKVSPNRVYNLLQGLRYLRDFAVEHPLVLPMLMGTVAFLAAYALQAFRTRRLPSAGSFPVRSKAPWVVIAASMLAVVGLPIVTGGDHFEGFRVILPVWPLFAAMFLYGLSCVPPAWPRRAAVVALAVGTLIWGHGHWRGDLQAYSHEYNLAARGRALGTLLNQVTSPAPHPSIGVIAAGGVATTYRGPIFDLMGLNNVRMGHSPGERIGTKNHAAFSVSVFWELEPELVTPRLVEHEQDLQHSRQWLDERNRSYLRNLMNTAQFAERYQLLVFTRASDESYPLVLAYARRDWLAAHGGHLRWRPFQ